MFSKIKNFFRGSRVNQSQKLYNDSSLGDLQPNRRVAEPAPSFNRSEPIFRAETPETKPSVKKPQVPKTTTKKTKRLTEDQVRYLLIQNASGNFSEEQLAERFHDQYGIKIPFYTLTRVLDRTTYSHIKIPPNPLRIGWKLTMDQAREIRRKYAKGKTTYNELAKQYGVSASSICGIVCNTTYIDVNQPTQADLPLSNKTLKFHKSTKNRRKSPLDARQILDIREMYDTGAVSQVDLSQMFDVSQSFISCVLRGKIWSNVGGPLIPSK